METIKDEYLVEAKEAEALCDVFIKGVKKTALKYAGGAGDAYKKIEKELVEDFNSFLREAHKESRESQKILIEALRSNLPLLITDTIDTDDFLKKVRIDWYSEIGFPTRGGPSDADQL